MITVTFTKNSNDSVFYWDNPITEGKFDIFMEDATRVFGDKMSKVITESTVSFTFQSTEVDLREFINTHYTFVDDLVEYCENHNITLNSPV